MELKTNWHDWLLIMVIAACVLAYVALLPACNTVHGFGQDLQNATGRYVENAEEK